MRNIKYSLGIILLFIALSVLAALFASIRLHAADKAVFQAYESRYASYLLADELRQSSDDLTRFARSYVITGEQRWADRYQAVLDIRNGARARPLHYERIYWDLMGDDDVPPQSPGKAESLRQRMVAADIAPGELRKLDVAQQESDALARLEQRSMAMVRGLYPDDRGQFTIHGHADPERARQLLYEPDYQHAKARIMQPIDDFYAMMMARSQARVDAARSAQAFWEQLAIGLVALVLIAVMLGGYAIAGLLKQLGGEPGGAIELASQIAAGRRDVTVDLQPGDQDSLLYHMKEMVEQLRTAEERQREYAEQLKGG